jgi:uncharacterized membrane protein
VALINPNQYARQIRDLEDMLADGITRFAGNMKFVYFHGLWFGIWISANVGLFGAAYMFDQFPFGLLTMVVSLEAIFLSTFVLISQNRSSEKAEIRAQLDYETDLQAEREIAIIMHTLVRLAEKSGINTKDLVAEMEEAKQLAKREADRRTENRNNQRRKS